MNTKNYFERLVYRYNKVLGKWGISIALPKRAKDRSESACQRLIVETAQKYHKILLEKIACVSASTRSSEIKQLCKKCGQYANREKWTSFMSCTVELAPQFI